MAKIANKYLEVNPWAVIEEGFHSEESRVSESIFSLGNEYMGVRGYFDEGYGGDRLVGSYFNGLYDEAPAVQSGNYKGFIRKVRYMVNTLDWLYTRMTIDGETLDLARSRVTNFRRVLDFKTGTLSREFIWHTENGKSLHVSFVRFVSMAEPHLGCQRIELTSLDFSGSAEVQSGLDFSPIHEEKGKSLWHCPRRQEDGNIVAILGETDNLGRLLFSGFRLDVNPPAQKQVMESEKFIGQTMVLNLRAGEPVVIDKIVTSYAEKSLKASVDEVWEKGMDLATANEALSFDAVLEAHTSYWEKVWNTLDITIEGDPENQQGIRFCIFQLHQTFHGADICSNIGAKGLTGESYNGHTFWDTETYCLPFYMFNNIQAARNLLEFRYRTLPQAMERAKELDCKGAFYPLATIDGLESCSLWQHASLQLHVGSAVAYGIWHYVKICNDKDFLYRQGVEMLIEVSRCYASRGQWGPRSGEFGFYGVMGPNEFQMMVNNNCYLNFMAKKTFDFTLETLRTMAAAAPDLLNEVKHKTGLEPAEMEEWANCAAKMRLPLDIDTQIFEEHDGFFDMPHIDIHKIPVTDFPLYHNWSYDRIYRYDMIKQPDVLMFLFLYNQEFSTEIKRANYEFYEPRCIHESSLSPSIHSILAVELGKHEEAYDFFRFATRMDLDNYNRNTREGLHTTSIAAAWMNIVYGFGGMRSDGEMLAFKPSIPKEWSSYSFRVLYHDAVLTVFVDRTSVTFKINGGAAVTVKIYGSVYDIDTNGVKLNMPTEFKSC